MVDQKNTPYEVLNALEWQADNTALDAYGFDEDSDNFEGHDDEWAAASTTSNQNQSSTRPTNVAALSTDQHRQEQHPRPQTGVPEANTEKDGGNWNLVSNREKATKEPLNMGPRSDSWVKTTTPARLNHCGAGPPKIDQQSKVQPLNDQTDRAPLSVTRRRVIPQDSERRQHHLRVYHFAQDNTAKAAYRRRQPETDRLELYKNPDEIEPDQAKMYKMLEELGVRMRTFLRPPQDAKDRFILIWGDPLDVSRTLKALKAWLIKVEEGPSERPSRFAEVKSTATDRHRKQLQRLEKGAELKAFQQIPDPNKHFPFQGWIMWLDEEMSPCDVFGLSLEAFDPIRFENKSHIIYNETIQTIRVLSKHKDHVDRAVERIRTAIDGVKAQSCRNIAEYLVDVSPPLDYGDEVTLHEHVLESERSRVLIPLCSGHDLRTRAKGQNSKSYHSTSLANKTRIEEAFGKIVPSLSYHVGQLRVRLVFGLIGLKKFPLPAGRMLLPVEKFMTALRMPGVKVSMIRYMNHWKEPRAVMERIFGANDLLEPVGSTNEGLEAVAPAIGARFVIHRMDRPSVRLDLEYKETHSLSNTYEAGPAMWTRNDGRDSQTPLQIFMVQLDGKTSSGLEVTKERMLDDSRIDPKMTSFSNSIKLKPNDIKNAYITGRRQVFANESEVGSLKPSYFEQKIGFRYRLSQASQWILEVARFDTYKAGSDLPDTTHWAASMSNSDWDSVFSQNVLMGIGNCAAWDPKLETFFPSEDIGSSVAGLLQSVRQVTELLDGMKKAGS